MKNLIIIIIINGTIISSCIKDYETVTSFYVKNISNHEVILTVFNAEFQTLGSYKDTSYTIPQYSEISYYSVSKGKDSHYYYPFGPLADSAFITFDNSLRIIYRRNDSSPRNILNIENYKGGKKNDELYEYTYSITNEDYANAIEIK
jgi:hypothetical protein